MFLRKKIQFLMLVVLAIALISVPVSERTTAQVATYAVIDLGTLGGSESKAFGISNAGTVVGHSINALGFKVPFVWKSGVMNGTIGTFGGNTGTADAVSEIGYVVGAADALTITSPFIWSDIFGKKDLGSLGGTSAAYDINNANQIVGQSDTAGGGSVVNRAFVWDVPNGLRQIATLGGSSNAAFGINDGGQIVGYSITTSGVVHAFLLSGGALTDLGTLGGEQSIAHKINHSGQVVGYSTLSSGTLNPPFHAFLWSPGGQMMDLGALAGNRSIAYDINNLGQVVGASEIAAGMYRAFVYAPLTGLVDLNQLIPGSGWTLLEARGINDKGQIVGFGINPSGFTHGFLLLPQVDDIPGGEPPPCASVPTSPIILPEETPLPKTNLKNDKRIRLPRVRREAISPIEHPKVRETVPSRNIKGESGLSIFVEPRAQLE
jgi:probable HAF family extracellular repeat protein